MAKFKSKDCFLSSQIAAELGLKSANELNAKLVELQVLKQVNGSMVLRANYAGKGYAKLEYAEVNENKKAYVLLWTPEGRQLVLNTIENANRNR